MELYQDILTRLLYGQTIHVTFPGFKADALKLVDATVIMRCEKSKPSSRTTALRIPNAF